MQASLVVFGQVLSNRQKKSLSDFQIHKSTLLITGSGSGRRTSFHTVPSDCRIAIPSETPNIDTFTCVLKKPQFPTWPKHILLTPSPTLRPHTTLHLEKKDLSKHDEEHSKVPKQFHLSGSISSHSLLQIRGTLKHLKIQKTVIEKVSCRT